jgi:hypothetical protein
LGGRDGTVPSEGLGWEDEPVKRRVLAWVRSRYWLLLATLISSICGYFMTGPIHPWWGALLAGFSLGCAIGLISSLLVSRFGRRVDVPEYRPTGHQIGGGFFVPCPEFDLIVCIKDDEAGIVTHLSRPEAEELLRIFAYTIAGSVQI